VADQETSALDELLRPLADGTRAEFLAELRRLSLHQDDDELFKLLKILSLYAAFYETIPDTIREVHDRAIARMEVLARNPLSDSAPDRNERTESLLRELAEAVDALRNAAPPPFEEFRTNVESLQVNAANINRYGRELIVELQKNAALARRGSAADGGTFFFTALIGAATGALVVYLFMRFFQ